MSEVKQIPLQHFHEQKGARFVPFAGWNMPVQYTSIIQEHQTVRNSVGLFDVSHMGEIILQGPESIPYLNFLLTNDYSTLAVGASKYSMMCYPDGGVVDDLIVYRLQEEKFLICVNASNCEKDFAWMVQHKDGFEVQLDDQSEQYALLAVQGPQSVEFLQPLVSSIDLSKLKRFNHVEATIEGVELILSATGYTGENGFELYIPSEKSADVAQAISNRAEELELKDFYCGLGCRDSLRLEAGYPLYGHEISEKIDPISAGLGWTVKTNKDCDFLGKDHLARLKNEKPDQVVKFFKLSDRRIARQGEPVWSADQEVGQVLSGSFLPGTGVAIGSALIQRSALKTGNLEVRLRGKPFEVELVKPPIG